MTRKDYVKFARMLRERELMAVLWDDDGSCRYFFKTIVERCADIFQEDNKRFNRERFINAVYNGEGI